MSYKIVFLGGGSPFVPAMMKAIISRGKELEKSDIYLMDIDSERLQRLAEFGNELSRRAEVDLNFHHTLDPEGAMKGADFIFPTYRVGGLEHMRYDIAIPTKYGIVGDETTGPGGTFMAQMTIPVTLEYCNLIEELCPEAWVISVINPANAVADAVLRKTSVNYISICDCFAGLAMETLPRVLGMPSVNSSYTASQALKPRSIGVNHMTWLVELKVDGDDAYDQLKAKLRDYDGEKIHNQEPTSFSLELLETYGYLNTCPTHVLPYWEHEKFLEERRERIFEEEVLGWSKERWGFIEDFLDGGAYSSRPKEYCFSPHHSNQAVGIMMSIILDENKEWGGVNFRNEGAIPNLPRDAVVEGPVRVDEKGVEPLRMGNLPDPFVGLTHSIISWQKMTVEAAFTKDKNKLLQAILACPYVHDLGEARKIMLELLDLHGDFLPQYD